MHRSRRRAGKAIGLAITAALVTSPAVEGQVSKFRYRAALAPTGMMYRYLKTNLDGSHPGQIALYVVSPDSLEAFKYGPEETEFSLVSAVMDWSMFSPARLDSWRVRAGGWRKHLAALRYDRRARALVLTIGAKSEATPVRSLPWHSYDFDFASLNVVFRHLIRPDGAFAITLVDPTYQDGGPFMADKGMVDVRYVGTEQRDTVATKKYRIDGPGLSNRGGFIWIDATRGHLVEFEIHIGDEPGYDTGRMRLLDAQKMDRAAWDAFIESRFHPANPQAKP
ncbi:MAG: hypothetical protein ABI647_06455 [Gemmatimonadota bacterium]